MTEKIFWQDPYAAFHDTRIATVRGAQLTVDSTIFYAFSGGQESDEGTIGGYPVLEARRDGLEIFYTLPGDHDLRPLQPVRMTIDWNRRYRLMRLHFAAELILELFYKSLNGIVKVGAHIAEEKARVDFSWQESIAPMLPLFAAEVDRLITADLPITSGFEDEKNERRYWQIDGFSHVPCGGTHLRRTWEIGSIRLKRNNIGRGKERVEIYLND